MRRHYLILAAVVLVLIAPVVVELGLDLFSPSPIEVVPSPVAGFADRSARRVQWWWYGFWLERRYARTVY